VRLYKLVSKVAKAEATGGTFTCTLALPIKQHRSPMF
jgi:hypothetical protein